MSLDQPDTFVKHQTVSRDAFLGGRLTVSQPREGFRAGLDSVLLGAAVGPDRHRLLDLGAGVGTAAYVALALNPGLTAVLAEREQDALELARRNGLDNGLADRATVLELDVTGTAGDRRAAGLVDNGFDVVIANPPFFSQHAGTLASDDRRAAARHMNPGEIEAWARTAAAACAAAGEVIFIYPAQGLGPLLAAVSQRFGAVTVLPLSPRPGLPANRVLLRGTKGSRAPFRLLANRALHEAEGARFCPDFDAIFRGLGRLDW